MIKLAIPLVTLGLLVIECGGDVVEEPHYTIVPQPPIVCQVGVPCCLHSGGCDAGEDADAD